MTTKGRYALRACLAMARTGTDVSPVSIRQLAESEGLSLVFLEQLFSRLRKAGLVESIRGPSGGFRFTRPTSEISIRAILEAVGEGLSLSPCADTGLHCEHSSDCIARSIWLGATVAMNDYFDGLSIADAIARFSSGDTRK